MTGGACYTGQALESSQNDGDDLTRVLTDMASRPEWFMLVSDENHLMLHWRPQWTENLLSRL